MTATGYLGGQREVWHEPVYQWGRLTPASLLTTSPMASLRAGADYVTVTAVVGIFRIIGRWTRQCCDGEFTLFSQSPTTSDSCEFGVGKVANLGSSIGLLTNIPVHGILLLLLRVRLSRPR